jgi:type II secretory pathway pseudopilin PulG
MSNAMQKKYNQGFSLIEVLVYLAVTVLISLAGVLTYISLDDVLVRNATERAVNHSAQVALERIGREIKSAISVNAAMSTFNTSPGALTLVYGATTTNFAVVGDALVLTVNGVEIGPLTSDSVIVEDFTLNRYVGTTTELIRASLTISGNSKAASTTRTYYTSAVLRGSYE